MAAKGNIIGIVAWVLVGILAIAAGALGFAGKQQSDRAAGLREALVQVLHAAGVQELEPEVQAASATEDSAAPAEEGQAAPAAEPQALTAEALKSDAVLSGALEKAQASIQGTREELAGAKDALSAAQAEASGAKAELAQRMQEQSAKLEAATKELAAKDEAIAAAKAGADAALQAAKDAAEKQKAELEASIESLKAQMAEESARLQAELDAARQPGPEPVGATADVSEGAEGALPEAPGVVVSAPAASPEFGIPQEEGRILGPSKMFSLIRYSEADQSLFFRLLDKQTLTYKAVPPDVFDRLISAGDMVDMHFRFKIQGAFKSLPPDNVVIRKYWKWNRRQNASGEVRVIESKLPRSVAEDADSVHTPNAVSWAASDLERKADGP